MSDEAPLLKDILADEFDKLSESGEEAKAETALGRDEKGRFASKKDEESTEEPEVSTAVEEFGEETPDQGTEPEPEPAEQPLSAPDRWSAEWKAKFTALPRDAQQVLLDREGEYDKGFTQKSQEASELKKRYEPLEQILAPRRQAWAMQGMDEGRAVSQLLALSDFAASKPQEFISWFAQQRGINPASLNPGSEPSAPDPFAPVLNKIQTLEQQLNAQRDADTNRQIDSFRSAPGHEHFDEVRLEMGRLLESRIATDMQDAYEKACRVNPAVSQKIEASKLAAAEADRKASEAKRVTAAKEAAAKAKKTAGVTITPKASLNGGAPAPANMRESLNQAWDEIQGAA